MFVAQGCIQVTLHVHGQVFGKSSFDSGLMTSQTKIQIKDQCNTQVRESGAYMKLCYTNKPPFTSYTIFTPLAVTQYKGLPSSVTSHVYIYTKSLH